MLRRCSSLPTPVAATALAVGLAAALAPRASAQEVVDQQNPAAAFTCLNVGSYTMSQTFTPTFDRLNFAEIHFAGNSGPAVNGDFTLRLLRNGTLVRESDHLALAATAGFASGYRRFNFSSEAFLVPGQQYELQLVNHSSTGFFRWCQSQTNSYAGGSAVISPAGGTGGDLLFRTGMQSVFGPPQAATHGDGYMLFETALPSAAASSGGISVSGSFYSGVNFEIDKPTRLSRIGGRFNNGTLFGAVVQATGFGSIPNPYNLTGSDVLATTLLTVPAGGGDAYGNVDVELQPGWYGIIFGAGRFGAPATSSVLSGVDPPNGFWSPYSIRQSDGQRFFQASDVRIFAESRAGMGQVQERPTFDTLVEKFAGQWILTDGAESIAPERIDSLNVDARGLLEFSLAEVPAGATITGARISLDFNQLTSGGAGGPRLFFHGYAADGLPAAADAAVPLNQIGASDVITQFDVIDVPLDAAYIQSLVDAGATHLGLNVRADNNGHRAHFLAWEEGDPASVPLLTIDYAVSLPGDFDSSGAVDFFDLIEWQNRYGADLDGQDFLVWQRNLGAPGASPAAVPEPAAWVLALAAAFTPRIRRVRSVPL